METVEKAFEFAFYPTGTQKRLLASWFGGCRAVYNLMLAEQTANYEDWKALNPLTRGKAPFMNYVAMSKRLTELKRTTHPWLNETSSVALQESLKTLETAYKNFFAKRGGYPRFKAKDNLQRVSLTYRGFGYDSETARLRLSGTYMKLRGGRKLPNQPLRITITKDLVGKYYVKAVCRVPAESLKETHTKANSVGVDMGIKEFATLSNDTSVKLLPILKPYYHNVKVKQRELSKVNEMIKATKDETQLAILKALKFKCRKIVARAHAKVVNVRKDALHKLTRSLVTTFKAIGIEGLKITKMVQSAKHSHNLKKSLPRTIMQSCWGEFFRQLIYKAKWSQSTKIVVMDSAFPSTQIHHPCGVRSKTKIPLNHRKWFCSECKDWVERDVNAATNIRAVTDWVLRNTPNVKEPVIVSPVLDAIWI